MTYQPAVYREQGGDKLIVASSGEVEVQSGGLVDIQSGSSFTMATDMEVKSGGLVSVESGATVTVESGGYLKLPRIARSTTDTSALVNQSIAIMTGSSTGPNFALPAPQSGSWMYIKCISVGSGGNLTISSTVDITSGKNRLKFDAIDEAVTLAGTSTGWHVVANVGSVASTSG